MVFSRDHSPHGVRRFGAANLRWTTCSDAVKPPQTSSAPTSFSVAYASPFQPATLPAPLTSWSRAQTRAVGRPSEARSADIKQSSSQQKETSRVRVSRSRETRNSLALSKPGPCERLRARLSPSAVGSRQALSSESSLDQGNSTRSSLVIERFQGSLGTWSRRSSSRRCLNCSSALATLTSLAPSALVSRANQGRAASSLRASKKSTNCWHKDERITKSQRGSSSVNPLRRSTSATSSRSSGFTPAPKRHEWAPPK